jgi:hypothetical protein
MQKSKTPLHVACTHAVASMIYFAAAVIYTRKIFMKFTGGRLMSNNLGQVDFNG